MAGVRKLASGTWQGWYMNHAGKRQFFTLSKTAGKRETLQAAQDLDTHHRKIALGVLPPPARHRMALTQTMEEVISEYLRWGAFQGGIGGRPWSAVHQRNRARQLRWWCTTLGLETLADCHAIRSTVEQALQELGQAGRSGRTLMHSARSAPHLLWVVCRTSLSRGESSGADDTHRHHATDQTPGDDCERDAAPVRAVPPPSSPALSSRLPDGSPRQ